MPPLFSGKILSLSKIERKFCSQSLGNPHASSFHSPREQASHSSIQSSIFLSGWRTPGVQFHFLSVHCQIIKDLKSRKEPTAMIPTFQSFLSDFGHFLFSHLIKWVGLHSSVSGKPNCSLPKAMLFIRNTIFLASIRMVCLPSSSISASPLPLP